MMADLRRVSNDCFDGNIRLPYDPDQNPPGKLRGK